MGRSRKTRSRRWQKHCKKPPKQLFVTLAKHPEARSLGTTKNCLQNEQKYRTAPVSFGVQPKCFQSTTKIKALVSYVFFKGYSRTSQCNLISSRRRNSNKWRRLLLQRGVLFERRHQTRISSVVLATTKMVPRCSLSAEPTQGVVCLALRCREWRRPHKEQQQGNNWIL